MKLSYKNPSLTICLFLSVSCNYNSDKLTKIGDEYFKKNEYDKAIEKYEKALEKDPHNLTAIFKLGNSHLRKEDTAKTVYYYNIAANRKYNDYELYKFLGIYYTKTDTNLAIKYLSIAIRYKKDDYESLTERGILYFDRNMINKASADFSNAIKASQIEIDNILSVTEGVRKNKGVEKNIVKYIKPYIYNAKIKELKKDYYGLIIDYCFLIDALPNYYDFYLKRGIVKLKLNKVYDACIDFTIANQNGIIEANDYLKRYCKTCTD